MEDWLMASVVQFVSGITSSPTVRLNLNDTTGASGLMVRDTDIDLSPPALRYAVASTMLQDGDHITAAAYENRKIKLPLSLVYAASTDAAATAMQNLARELNRPSNILKVQLHGATSPVFFRTFRTTYALEMLRLLVAERTFITLEIDAEPFAYGLREDPVVNVTVNANPAAGSNGCFVDVTGVKGDVETPALIKWPESAVIETRQSLFASRRRGTPSQMPFVFQAEAMTQSTNTTVQANDAAFSGAGSNYSRCTFAIATFATRILLNDLGAASVDLRGTYRVFLRYRKNTAADVINLRAQWGDANAEDVITNDVFSTTNDTSFHMADLGFIKIPVGADPVYDLRTGVELAVADGFLLEVDAERPTGSGTLDLDYVLLVPADDRLAIVEWGETTFGTGHRWLDAHDNSIHARTLADEVMSIQAPKGPIGGLPMLTPNQTNRLTILHEVSRTRSHLISFTASISVSYFPRYLSLRPAAT